ncbi:MAG: DUF389 domain-containing protein [Planctomycetes bacterium]|nr:DUF389 domain-containing protein [Planctomycetota bacterium]
MSSGVVVVVRAPSEVVGLVTWAMRFALVVGAEQVDVVDVTAVGARVGPVPLDAPESADDRVAAAVRESRAASQAQATPKPAEGWHSADALPELSLRRVSGSRPIPDLLSELGVGDAKLLVYGDGEDGPVDRKLSQELLRRAPCEVLWLRCADRASRSGRMLVPITGGPNSATALRRATELTQRFGGVVHALLVEPPIGADAVAVGGRIAGRLVNELGERGRGVVEPRVVVAEDPVRAITDAWQDGEYDVLLVGASPVVAMQRFFSGRIGERLRERTASAGTVGIVRQAVPLHARLGSRLSELVRAVVPQVDRAGRIELTERIQQASSFGFDFVALVCLATLIAALGLIRGSAAVVIGAMLVAPLMTPLVGCGLAIVQGNARLVRGAALSVLLGFVLAFLIGTITGALIPGVTLNAELASRCAGADGIDFAVAFASGLAAAYATARPGLSAALPGVAIAAALVPPIASSGITASLAKGGEAWRAFELFFVNIVAIVLGSAVSMFAVGLRGDRQQRRPWQIQLLLGLSIVAVALVLWLRSRPH